jgi:hypothetical protein
MKKSPPVISKMCKYMSKILNVLLVLNLPEYVTGTK